MWRRSRPDMRRRDGRQRVWPPGAPVAAIHVRRACVARITGFRPASRPDSLSSISRVHVWPDHGIAAEQRRDGRRIVPEPSLDPMTGLVYTPPALRAADVPTSPAAPARTPGHPASSAHPCPATGSGRTMPRAETRPVGGDLRLAEVRVGENETFESALRRFNKKIQQSGILAEARRREHYEKPSVKRKRKEAKRKKATRQD